MSRQCMSSAVDGPCFALCLCHHLIQPCPPWPHLVLLYLFILLSYLWPYPTLTYLVWNYHALLYLALPYRGLLYFTSPCVYLTLPCLALLVSCLHSPCPTLPPALPYPALLLLTCLAYFALPKFTLLCVAVPCLAVLGPTLADRARRCPTLHHFAPAALPYTTLLRPGLLYFALLFRNSPHA